MEKARIEKKITSILKCSKDAKTSILFEFAKVCPTENSFNAVKKTTHDIFDVMELEINNLARELVLG